ncbi:hypothetical protein AC578_3318 [Pseudocercospora eumusae]|uniref:Uncharacterized protein n=1 Tax=Pseudocercospora eumusae TaxID=321146 RepID=A0A139GU29_9PEZI|nr:hypothetical protein AC578_3318 [Pseudocercospora eumusae]
MDVDGEMLEYPPIDTSFCVGNQVYVSFSGEYADCFDDICTVISGEAVCVPPGFTSTFGIPENYDNTGDDTSSDTTTSTSSSSMASTVTTSTVTVTSTVSTSSTTSSGSSADSVSSSSASSPSSSSTDSSSFISTSTSTITTLITITETKAISPSNTSTTSSENTSAANSTTSSELPSASTSAAVTTTASSTSSSTSNATETEGNSLLDDIKHVGSEVVGLAKDVVENATDSSQESKASNAKRGHHPTATRRDTFSYDQDDRKIRSPDNVNVAHGNGV